MCVAVKAKNGVLANANQGIKFRSIRTMNIGVAATRKFGLYKKRF